VISKERIRSCGSNCSAIAPMEEGKFSTGTVELPTLHGAVRPAWRSSSRTAYLLMFWLRNFSLRDGVSHAKSSERRKMVQTELPMFGKPLSEQCLKRSEIKFGYQCREFRMKLFPVRVLNPKVVDFAAYRIQVSNSDCIP